MQLTLTFRTDDIKALLRDLVIWKKLSGLDRLGMSLILRNLGAPLVFLDSPTCRVWAMLDHASFSNSLLLKSILFGHANTA